MRMFEVLQTGEDGYEVRGFLQSLPNATATVQFKNGTARVISRTGYSDPTFDRHAIGECQFAIATGNFKDQRNQE